MIEKKNLYPIFIGAYVLVALATLWNIREMHKVRQLQKKDLENKLDGAK
tara:strand:- start:31087 stop:31233 length:147 start_codon:yes stop_codon:yes gene_type:complete